MWRIKGDELRGKEKQLTLVYHLSLSHPPSPRPHPGPRSSTRFVAIIVDNLQYNLVCSFLKWSDNISSDHEWNGSTGDSKGGRGSTVEKEWGGATGEVEKDREAVAPLFFMWKSYSAGVYDQLPGCFHSRIYTHPHTNTHTHTLSSPAESVEDYRFLSDQCSAFFPPAEVSSFRSSHRFAVNRRQPGFSPFG